MIASICSTINNTEDTSLVNWSMLNGDRKFHRKASSGVGNNLKFAQYVPCKLSTIAIQYVCPANFQLLQEFKLRTIYVSCELSTAARLKLCTICVSCKLSAVVRLKLCTICLSCKLSVLLFSFYPHYAIVALLSPRR